MTFGIFITTHNRCDDLALTCDEIAKLNPLPDDVLICLDGCTDDSLQMLQRNFPPYRVIVNPTRIGSVPSRDRGFRQIACDIVISLDDDSAPIGSDFLLRLERVFERHDEAAVITFTEVRDDGIIVGHQTRSDSSGCYLPAFANCGAAYRRQAYGRIAAFSTAFEHAYEEPDYALQCYAFGWGIWYEPQLQIRHRVTPVRRNLQRIHAINARNEFLSVIKRCPMPFTIPVAAYRMVRQLVYAAGRGPDWMLNQHKWVTHAFSRVTSSLAHREPIPWHLYYAWMRLARNPLKRREELSKTFGEPRPLHAIVSKNAYSS